MQSFCLKKLFISLNEIITQKSPSRSSGMSSKNLTYQDLVQIIDLIKSSSHFDEFHLKTDELEVDIKRNMGSAPRRVDSAGVEKHAAPEQADAARPAQSGPAPQPASAPEAARPAPAEPPAANQAASASLDIPADAILIKSPMVGTFYRASEPGAAPFVEIGQQAEEMTTVCLIEVMKLINSIPAGQRGVVTHILVKDGDPVEYGQVLMALAPDA
jgi:acetyl-CoA carboxylase biotin carboxyl carrier protein